MSLFRSLLQAVRTWRRRRGGPKTTQRADVSVERLDHRQLLSANFSGSINFAGNVTTDFPSTLIGHGVVEASFNPNTDVVADVTNPTLDALIGRVADPLSPTGTFSENGFAIDKFRVSYDPSADTLNIGLIPPADAKIIAGDIDNSQNSAALGPAVQAFVNTRPDLKNTFVDFPDLQQTETMYSFLDLNGDGIPDIVAGFPAEVTSTPNVPAKVYEVAAADNISNPGTPQFGAPLGARFQGNVYLVNDPAHPNLEYSISHFSEIYQAANSGKKLDPKTAVISVGVVANSLNNPVLNGTFLALKEVPFSQATLPQPLTPPIEINPHQNSHINTAHPTDVQVAIFGGPTLDVSQIDPASVTLGGATPIFEGASRDVNHDGYPDRIFFFRGTYITLPSGLTQATVTGNLLDGRTFQNTVVVFNRDASFYTAGQVAQQQARIQQVGSLSGLTPKQFKFLGLKAPRGSLNDLAISQLAGGTSDSGTLGTGPTVSIPLRNPTQAVSLPVDSGTGSTVSIPTRGGKRTVTPRKLKVDTSSAASSLAV